MFNLFNSKCAEEKYVVIAGVVGIFLAFLTFLMSGVYTCNNRSWREAPFMYIAPILQLVCFIMCLVVIIMQNEPSAVSSDDDDHIEVNNNGYAYCNKQFS